MADSTTISKKTIDANIIHKIAKEENYDFDIIWKAYGLESIYGTELENGIYKGHYHMSPAYAKDANLKIDKDNNIDERYDLEKSTRAFIQMDKKNRNILNQLIKTHSNNFELINQINQKDPYLLTYLLHQQGATGVKQMSLAYTEDDTASYNMSRRRMLANLGGGYSKDKTKYYKLNTPGGEQMYHFVYNTKTYQEAIDYFIESQIKNLNIKLNVDTESELKGNKNAQTR